MSVCLYIHIVHCKQGVNQYSFFSPDTIPQLSASGDADHLSDSSGFFFPKWKGKMRPEISVALITEMIVQDKWVNVAEMWMLMLICYIMADTHSADQCIPTVWYEYISI